MICNIRPPEAAAYSLTLRAIWYIINWNIFAEPCPPVAGNPVGIPQVGEIFFEYVKNFTDYKVFSAAHISFFAAAIVITIVASLLLKNRSAKAVRISLIVCACLVVFNYAFLQLWRVWAYADGRAKGILDKVAYIMMPNEILPFQLCSMLCYIIPAAVILKKRWLYDAVAPICIMGGFLFFFYPTGIIDRYPPFSFRVLESMFQHTVILFFGVFLYASGQAKMQLKTIHRPMLFLLGIGAIAIAANLVFGTVDDGVNFFYIRKNILGLNIPFALNALLMAAVAAVFFFLVLGVQMLFGVLAARIGKKRGTVPADAPESLDEVPPAENEWDE